MITNVITQVAGQQNPSSVTTIVKCDLSGCTNSVSFDENSKQKTLADTPWLRTYRTVQTGDGRFIGYCGDVHEIEGIKGGQHNLPEPKKIIEAANPAAVAAAAQAAEAARNSDTNLKSGTGGPVLVQG